MFFIHTHTKNGSEASKKKRAMADTHLVDTERMVEIDTSSRSAAKNPMQQCPVDTRGEGCITL